MEFDSVLQKAKLSGLSKILGTPESLFVFLSDNTTGRCGRRIYINSNLQNVFLQHVAAEDFGLIMHKLEQLRATAGGLKTFSCIDNAFEHFSTVERFQVGYKIFQNTGSSQRKPGIYITSLEAFEVKGEKPGLYNVKEVDGKWGAEESERIIHNYAAVNGLTRNLPMAADKIIPPMLESAYNSKEYQGSVKDGYSLIYNPPELHYQKKRWKTPQNKINGKSFTAKLLGDSILEAQRRGKEVNWVVHGDGAKIFLEAMQRISNHKLDKHRVLFLAPRESMVNILPLVRQSQMKLHKSVMKFQADDWSEGSFKNRTHTAVGKEVEKFGEGFKQKSAEMRLEATSNSLKVGALALTAGSLYKLPAALAAPSLAWRSQSLRNMASLNIADPALNPHLHPFKSKSEMHAHVITETGGLAKSFAAVVKARLKGRNS